MLTKLFGSQARVKILKLFLINCDSKYFVKQLSKDLGLQAASVKRELDNLENFGLLVSDVATDEEIVAFGVGDIKKKIGTQDRRYYMVDHSFPLCEEIKAIIIKSHVLYKHDFIDDIKKAGDIKVLILSGVFMNSKEALVDLLIVGVLNKNKFEKVIKGYEKELGKEVNYTCMSEREFKYRKSMTDVFLYDVLEGDNMVVINSEGLL